LRETVWPQASYAEMSAAAESIPPGSEGLIFHPHLNGEWAPYWDGELRGNFVGLTIRHTRAHLARSVMEGVAFALRAGVEYARNFGLPFDDIRLIGGGSGSDIWAQIMADTLNRRILVPRQKDAAYGSALVTGMGIGMFPEDADGIEKLIRFEDSLEPNEAHIGLYQQLFEIYQSTDIALHAATRDLARFDQQTFKSNQTE
jgi:xylulokinase